MRIWVCGVRGSTPAVGHEYSAVGGHTSCLAIGGDDGPPRLIVDAGTGLRAATDVLAGAAFAGTILVSHLHWDHTHGLPFFAAGDRPDARVRVLVPRQERSAFDLVARVMSPPHFPIGPDQLRGDWTFADLDDGVTDLEGFTVLARDIPHKGGRTFGFRVSDGHHSVAYLSDHAPQDLGPGPSGVGVLHDNALELARDVDLLFHDAQYCAAELPRLGSFGHAAYEYAVELAQAAGVARLMLFHHDPSRTDVEVDRFAADARTRAGEGALTIDVARQGTIIDL